MGITVESYRFGHVVVDGRAYDRDVVILPDRVWDGWWREQGHRLAVVDLKEVFDAQPEVLVVGTGFFGLMQVPAETREDIEKRGIELHVGLTPKAWALYNQLSEQGRKAVAALHLSC